MTFFCELEKFVEEKNPINELHEFTLEEKILIRLIR